MPLMREESSFVVSNLVTHDVHLFGAKIRPGHRVDLFRAIEGLDECRVVNALHAPEGEIYLKVQRGKIAIDSFCLNTFENEPNLPVNLLDRTAVATE